jgi:hypothetical protein
LKRTSTAIGFQFLNFDLEYLKRVQSSEPLHAKINPTPIFLDHGLHVLKLRSCPPNHDPKMQERHQLSFGVWLMSNTFQHPAIRNKIDQHFAGFFHEITVCQPIGRQDFKQTVIRTSRRLDAFLHEVA